jgi:hypothetical protein
MYTYDFYFKTGDILKAPINRSTLIMISIFLIIASLGCLETPVATPALIHEDALTSYGWSQIDDIEYNTFEQEISNSTTLFLNSTTVKYQNDRLISDIEEQTGIFKEEYKLPPEMQFPTLTAHITTIRIALPGKARIPSDIFSKIVDSSVEEMNEQNSIGEINESNKMQLITNSGATIYLSTFTGAMPMENSSLKMLGFVAVIENEEFSTIVYGMTPNGTLPVKVGPLEANMYSIDGERELNEMIELSKTIE